MDTNEQVPYLYTTKISIDDGQFAGILNMQPKEFEIIAKRGNQNDGERRYSWHYKQIVETLISLDGEATLFVQVVNRQPGSEQLLKISFENHLERDFFVRRFRLFKRLYKGKIIRVVSTRPDETAEIAAFPSSLNPVNSEFDTNSHQSDRPENEEKEEEEMKHKIRTITHHPLETDFRVPDPQPVLDRSRLSPLDGTPPKNQVRFFATKRGDDTVLPLRYLTGKGPRTEPYPEVEKPQLKCLRSLAARTTKEDLQKLKNGTDGLETAESTNENGSSIPKSLNNGTTHDGKSTSSLSMISSKSKDDIISLENLTKLAGAKNSEKKDEIISKSNLAKLAGVSRLEKKDDILSMNNLAKLAGPRSSKDLQSLPCSSSSSSSELSSGTASPTNQSNSLSKTTSIDDMLSIENLKRLAKSKDKISETSVTKVKVPVKIDAGDNDKLVLQAEANLSLKLSIDLVAALSALEIQDRDERVEQIRRHVKFETTLCDLTFN